MEDFCGSHLFESPLSNSSADALKLTICLRSTLCYWIPVLVYFLLFPFWIRMLRTRKIPPAYLKPSTLFYFKILGSICLIIVCVIMLIAGIVHEASSDQITNDMRIAPAFYLLYVLLIMTFVSSIYVILEERKHGKYSSMLLFLLYLTLVVASIPSVNDFYKDTSKFVHITFQVMFSLLVVQLVAFLFSESHKYASNDLQNFNVSPEYYVGVLQKLYFSFMTRMVRKGYKRPLVLDDVWQLEDNEKSSNICERLQSEWDKQIARCRDRIERIDSFTSHPNAINLTSPHGSSTNNTQTNVNVTTFGRSRFKLFKLLHLYSTRPSITVALVKAFKGKLLISAFLKLIYDVLQFAPPLILGLILNVIEDPSKPLIIGISYSVLMFVNTSVQTCILHQYFQRMMLLGQRWRTALIAMVYRKSLRLSSDSRQKSTVGEMVNLMSVDAQRLMDLSSYLQIIWSGPLQIVIAIALLWITLGPSIIAGIVVLLLAIPLNMWIGARLKKLQGAHMKLKDIRIKDMNEILNGIKVIKLYAWEELFVERISKTRQDELILLRKTYILSSIVSLIWTITPFMVSVVTFAVYVTSSSENILTADKAFVSLSLFSLLRFPLFMFATVLTSFVQAKVSMTRLEDFFMLDEIKDDAIERRSLEGDAIRVKDGNFNWNKKTAALRNVEAKIKKGSLVSVVGDVGSGKTAFLQALLGELEKQSGSVQIDGTVAYVPQHAWILNATVRDNITMLNPFNQKLYDTVIESCALQPDLDILPSGDQTEIGERGINLSGGQKQRLSLARAIYSNADIYLLDDPLSAVDSHVAKHIFNKAIGPTGLLNKKSRILVTNALSFMPKCHSIIYVRDGMIIEDGKFDDLIAANGDFANLAKQYLNDLSSNVADDSDFVDTDTEDFLDQLSQTQKDKLKLPRTLSERKDRSPDGKRRKKPTNFGRQAKKGAIKAFSKLKGARISMFDTPSKRNEAAAKSKLINGTVKDDWSKEVDSKELPSNRLTTEEHVETDKIKMTVVQSYFQSYGRLIRTLLPFIFVLTTVAQLGYNLWLSDWSSKAESEANDTARRDLRIGIYALLGSLHGFIFFASQVLLLIGAYKASVELHSQLLNRCMRGTMSFYDSTPLGRILNRFSKDVDAVDYTLPNSLRSAVSTFESIMSTLIIIAITNPIFLAIAAPIAVMFFFLQRFYIKTSRQLRRIESVTRSPIYSHFSETLHGLQCIRASMLSDPFFQKNHELNNINVRAYYPSILINRWLAMILETLANIIVFSTCILAVTSNREGISGLAGLAISNALQITQALNWVVRMISEIETNIVAVERVLEYCEIDVEPEWIVDNANIEDSWPESGAIVIKDYFLRYRQNLDPVLKGISMNIKPCEKIGLVGRTGAGKSSLTSGLFRLVETTDGVIFIDNRMIKEIGLHQLRKKITVLPQDPVIFSGQLRFNLDPFEQCEDHQIWKALRDSSLEELVKSFPGQLDYEVSEGGENLSAGQRQLFCLARALLRKSKILVLDEATAAVDMETDDVIQNTIRKEFKDCTVITIAHRINTILDYDRIAVFDHGYLKEFDTPKALLAQNDSLFRSLVTDANVKIDHVVYSDSDDSV